MRVRHGGRTQQALLKTPPPLLLTALVDHAHSGDTSSGGLTAGEKSLSSNPQNLCVGVGTTTPQSPKTWLSQAASVCSNPSCGAYARRRAEGECFCWSGYRPSRAAFTHISSLPKSLRASDTRWSGCDACKPTKILSCSKPLSGSKHCLATCLVEDYLDVRNLMQKKRFSPLPGAHTRLFFCAKALSLSTLLITLSH